MTQTLSVSTTPNLFFFFGLSAHFFSDTWCLWLQVHSVPPPGTRDAAQRHTGTAPFCLTCHLVGEIVEFLLLCCMLWRSHGKCILLLFKHVHCHLNNNYNKKKNHIILRLPVPLPVRWRWNFQDREQERWNQAHERDVDDFTSAIILVQQHKVCWNSCLDTHPPHTPPTYTQKHFILMWLWVLT